MSKQALPIAIQTAPADPGAIDRFHDRHPVEREGGSVRWKAALIVEVVGILAVWEYLVGVAGVIRAAFLPPPTAIAASFWDLLTEQRFISDFTYSFSNLGVGLALACVIGISVGVAVGWSRRVGIAAGPVLWAIYSTPKVALTPLIILWLGIGPPSKILLVFLLAVFPVLLNTADGVRTVDASLIKAGRVFGAHGVDLARKVILPATLPFVLVGLRRGVALGFIGEILGEFVGGAHGIGHQLQIAVYSFRLDDALAIVVVMVIVVNAGLIALDFARRRFAPWHSEGPLAAT